MNATNDNEVNKKMLNGPLSSDRKLKEQEPGSYTYRQYTSKNPAIAMSLSNESPRQDSVEPKAKKEEQGFNKLYAYAVFALLFLMRISDQVVC